MTHIPNRASRTICGVAAGLIMTACGLQPVVSPGPNPAQTPAETATPAPKPTPTPFKPELVICTRTAPDSLLASASPNTAALAALVTGQAVVYGADYQAQPGISSLPNQADGSLKQNDDGTVTVTLRYRSDLKWSDGQPFDSADAVLGFKAAPPPGAPVDDVIDAQAVDPLTVQVRLAAGAQYPYVPSQPPLPHSLPNLDPAQLASNPYAKTVNPSLGAYYVSEWASDHILLQANPNSGLASIPVIRIGYIADPNQLVSALSSGTCDVVIDDALGVDQLAALDAASAGDVREYKFVGPVRDEIVLNTAPAAGRMPFLAMTPVRQAIAYGFDRAKAVQEMTSGLSQPLDSWLPAGHWAAGPGGFNAYGLDAAKAGALLDQAGWQDQDGDGIREYHGTGGDYSCQRGAWTIEDKTPLTPTLVLPNDDPRRVAFAQELQTQLKAVGIGLQLQAGSPASVFAAGGPIQHRDFDAALISMSTSPDPAGISQWVGAQVFKQPLDRTPVHRWQLEQRWLESDQLVETMALSNIPSPDNDWQGQNYAGWCNEQADVSVVQANQGFDLGARKGQYGQLDALLAGDVPVIPLAYRPRLAASKAYVCGIAPVPYGPLTWNTGTWYFDPQGACK